MHTYLDLIPFEWRQEIISDRRPNYRGRRLLCSAHIPDAGDIQLMNAGPPSLTEFDTQVVIVPEEQISDEMKLADKGIGFFIIRENFISTWFGVEQPSYDALWKQVELDNYAGCTICLDLEMPPPVRDNWVLDVLSNNKLLIRSASIRFTRTVEKKQVPAPRKRGFFK
jgi:hypothetical protein